MKHVLLSSVLWLVVADTAVACQRDDIAAAVTIDNARLVDAAEVASAIGWKHSVTPDGALLILCRDDDVAVCVPVDLRKTRHHSEANTLFVDPSALEQSLGIRLHPEPRGFRVEQGPPREQSALPPAFFDDWGPERGFQPGQVLPDIPLYDMDGREVRFSSFLGRQYIIYCWASW